MSRRESCVWHPMPEDVRRSSVQSRRASLAAGRRKSMTTNEPDWEVEAPATPLHHDYTPRDDHAVPAAAVAASSAAAVAAPSEENSPVDRDAVRNAAEEEHETVASVKSAEPTEASEENYAFKAEAQADAEAAGRGRTRHVVRFHGEKWAQVLRKQREEIETAFLEDIQEAAGVSAEEAKRLKIKMHGCMEVAFVVHSDSRARQKKIHAALQVFKFPRVCHIYTTFSA